MESMYEMLAGQLGGGALDQIGRQLGGDRRTAEKAVPVALGSLMGALAGNASERRGAESLLGALDRDHDGSVLDDLAGFLDRGDERPGAGILKHVLGSKQDTVATGIGQQTGLDAASTKRLLAMLAPLVLGALGKARRQNRFDAGGLSEMLGAERQVIQRRAPEGLGALGGLLDRDGDGQIGDDVAKIGGGLLKSFLSRRR